jgi:anthranilate phosphoribosyltransferase
MKKILQFLLEHKSLSKTQAKDVMMQIGKGNFTEAEVTAFITVYMMRTITIEELIGFKEAILDMSVAVKFEQENFIDIVGTGGDGKNTFNISTISAFVVAGAGYNVVKHGNYGVTSTSGSSNVMEYLGYTFSNDNNRLQKELTATNICFLHAPLFHPALKNVATIRKNLGLRTVFNILGPLVNPALPTNAVLGVYHLEIARFYNYVLQQSTCNYTIVHTMDGYDEIALTDDAKLITNKGEQILSPEYLGKRTVQLQDISGGNAIADAATIFMQILESKGTWAQNAVVIANAAVAIQNIANCTYNEAYAKAVESLESTKALQTLQKLIALQ